jgi:hypothetical protein
MHDLKKHLISLIEVLTSKDLPLMFLYGAGTSCSIEVSDPADPTKLIPLIPAVGKLTSDCKAQLSSHATLGKEFTEAWDKIEGETKALVNRTDIEAILSRIRQKRDALFDDTVHGLTRDQLEEFEKTVCTYIAKCVSVDESKLPTDLPHDKFARWIKSLSQSRRRPMEIFTTNYDILIERSLEMERVPHFDGFVGSYRPYFDSSVFDRDNAEIASSWIRLWKIHGSITWHSNNKEIYRGASNDSGEMILPSHYKYDESRKMPYRAMQDRLGRMLSNPDSALITVGYSFNDEHINETIFSSSDRSNSSIFVLTYSDLADDSPLVKLATSRHNITVLMPTRCLSRGKFGEWTTDSLESCSKDPLFSSVSSADRLTLGNFSAFCELLGKLSQQE